MIPRPLRLSSLSLSLLLFLTLAVAPPALAALSLRVVSEVHTEVTNRTAAALPDRREELDVTLGDDYLVVARPAAQMVYDFKHRRYYALDTADKLYVDYSLYSVVGFRTMELQYRAGIDRMLVAKGEAPSMRVVDREQELSVAESSVAEPSVAESSVTENTAAIFTQKTVGDMLVFDTGGATLARWSAQGTKVSAVDAAQFARFLRYTQAGHPQLLDRLAKGGVIPERLSFSINTMAGVRTVSLFISAVKPVAPVRFDLAGYTPRHKTIDAVDALLDRMAAQTAPQLDALRAAHPCDTEADYRADQLLDTMLGRTECVVATGAAMLPFAPAQLAQLRADGGVALMFAAIGPKNQDEIAASITTLEALRTEAPRKAYLLKLFEANNRRQLGQVRASLLLYVDVLAANPVLGGAYKDLGDVLLTQFDSARAWRSWDIGRAIAPKVVNFDAVNQLEQRLALRHPEFF